MSTLAEAKLANQLNNPISIRHARRINTARIAKSPARGMRTLFFVDFQSGRVAIYGLLPLCVSLLAEWNPEVADHYFGAPHAVDADSPPEDIAFGAASPLIVEYRDGHFEWIVCADDDLLEPSKQRIKALKQRALEAGASFKLFNAATFRAQEWRFVNSVLLNSMSHAAPEDRYNCYPERAAIQRFCSSNKTTCLSELQKITELDTGKVQGVVARMIRTGVLRVKGRDDELNRRRFTLLTPLEWQGERPRPSLRVVPSDIAANPE
ncbi:hypothetical protein LJR034_005175 [Caballeronia sp. LjRoot34]|uniref:hypothetical protein n=1 Tax=Caballeronia sp. LjRoot34 TaxID=3342325 RepID=UPI003ECCE78D